MDLEREHSSLLSTQSTPAAKRQLGQMNQEHSSQAYDNQILSRMGYSGNVVHPSDAYDRPNVSGLPSTNDQHVPNSEYYMKHDPYSGGVASEKQNNNRGIPTGSDHAGPASIADPSQLADEENIQLANVFDARTPGSNNVAKLIQCDGQSNNGPSYQHIRMLGHGGSASVEQVLDLTTGSVFARKTIRNVYSRNVEEAKRKLLNEIRIMQRLPHHHIVRVHSTRIEGRELTMILDPAADGGDLADYLQNYRDQGFHLLGEDISKENERLNFVLLKAFGCLASALDFIHRQTVRHKDIKPQNILIHKGKVMYTDFGLSYDFGDIGRSTTTGNPQGITRRYCAPEVAEWGRRNTKSDVFSLGCVFIEIILALANDAYYDLIYEGNFQEVVRSLPSGLPLPSAEFFKDSLGWEITNAIREMMRADSTSRPSASMVTHTIFHSDAPSIMYCLECWKPSRNIH